MLVVTVPLIIIYSLLFLLGISNVIRFIKVKSMSRNLSMIYFWSLCSNVAWITYFSLDMFSNKYQYMPYVTGVYCKILVGMAY